jgi:hypothetical protein
MKANERNLIEKFPPLPYADMNNEYFTMEINDNLAGIIKSHVVDAVVYGNKCTPEDLTRLHKFIPNFHTDSSQIIINKRPSDFLGNSQRRSFSQCFEDDSAIQPGSFIVSPETPGAKNDCQIEIKYWFYILISSAFSKSIFM